MAGHNQSLNVARDMRSRAVGASLLIAAGAAVLLAACAVSRAKSTGDIPAVAVLDVKRYAGCWYEIARLPHAFENGLVGVTATYALKEDGTISVLNQGYKGSLQGVRKSANGTAWVPDTNMPARLSVRFFWPFTAEYRVIALDENYRHALVTSSTKDYLWILSRSPQMDAATYERLVEFARARGFAVARLYKVPQPAARLL